MHILGLLVQLFTVQSDATKFSTFQLFTLCFHITKWTTEITARNEIGTTLLPPEGFSCRRSLLSVAVWLLEFVMFSVSCVEQFPSGHGDFFFWFVLQVSLSAQLSFVVLVSWLPSSVFIVSSVEEPSALATGRHDRFFGSATKPEAHTQVVLLLHVELAIDEQLRSVTQEAPSTSANAGFLLASQNSIKQKRLVP